jgi:hypothetical protein
VIIMTRSALTTTRPRGIRVARTPQEWARRDGPHLERVRTLAAAGATLLDLSVVIGCTAPDTVRQFLRRNGIRQARPYDPREVQILIEPVRWPNGPGRAYARFDAEDTDEL